ncbi:Polyketide cyclase / dehydrase and lipid transport [Sphingobium faniae]|nr:Polyketide cyclase / dehydrase and lipid transport [Sphingobium faniae]
MGGRIVADIEAPIDRVWSFVGDFGNVQRWHPLVERCELAGSGEGAVRTVHFADWSAVERLDRFDPEAHRLIYSIQQCDRENLVGLRGTIQLAPNGANSTRISWEFDQAPARPGREALLQAMESTYAARIGHLRDALGLAS